MHVYVCMHVRACVSALCCVFKVFCSLCSYFGLFSCYCCCYVAVCRFCVSIHRCERTLTCDCVRMHTYIYGLINVNRRMCVLWRSGSSHYSFFSSFFFLWLLVLVVFLRISQFTHLCVSMSVS